VKVLIINKFAQVTGGADRHALDVIRLLREQGHAVQLLSTANPQNLERVGQFVEPSVTSASRYGLSVKARASAARRALWNREAARATSEIFATFQPDIVHTHKLYPQLSVAPVVIAKRHGVPVVQTIHDYEFISANPLNSTACALDRQEETVAFRALNTATFAVRRYVHRPRVTTWIAVSEAVATIHREHGIEPVIIRNFVVSDRAEVPTRVQREGVLYVGRLTAEKGSDVIIEAARLLPNVRFTVAGMGPDAPLIEAAARELPNLVFLGRVAPTEVASLLRAAVMSLMPSRWQEPGPLTALEAMCAGTPIVAFDSGGLAEYVRRADAGIVVENTAAALVDGCRTLLESQTAWQRASDGGRAGVASSFSAERYAHEIVDVYEGALRACEGRAE
jgi:glycosyltransferase involved in cell wall biosynthesis